MVAALSLPASVSSTMSQQMVNRGCGFLLSILTDVFLIHQLCERITLHDGCLEQIEGHVFLFFFVFLFIWVVLLLCDFYWFKYGICACVFGHKWVERCCVSEHCQKRLLFQCSVCTCDRKGYIIIYIIFLCPCALISQFSLFSQFFLSMWKCIFFLFKHVLCFCFFCFFNQYILYKHFKYNI